MMSVDFTSSPLIPIASASTSSAFDEQLGHRHLDPEVVDLVAVVGEDDVDEVLADVVDVALHGPEDDPAPAARLGPLHVRLEMGDGGLHRLGRAEHERQLHLAGAEQLADGAHPGEQHVVHDPEGGVPGREGLVELGLEAVAVAVDDALLEPALDRPVGAVLDRRVRCRALALEGLDERRERVVALASPVVDEVEADLAVRVRDAVKGLDLAGVDDGGVEAGLRRTRAGRRS